MSDFYRKCFHPQRACWDIVHDLHLLRTLWISSRNSSCPSTCWYVKLNLFMSKRPAQISVLLCIHEMQGVRCVLEFGQGAIVLGFFPYGDIYVFSGIHRLFIACSLMLISLLRVQFSDEKTNKNIFYFSGFTPCLTEFTKYFQAFI